MNVYNFSFYYNVMIDKPYILNIPKYLMVKNNIKKCLAYKKKIIV